MPAVSKAECDTPAGYKKHLRNNEMPCSGCYDAEAARKRRRYRAVQQLVANHPEEFERLLAETS